MLAGAADDVDESAVAWPSAGAGEYAKAATAEKPKAATAVTMRGVLFMMILLAVEARRGGNAAAGDKGITARVCKGVMSPPLENCKEV